MASSRPRCANASRCAISSSGPARSMADAGGRAPTASSAARTRPGRRRARATRRRATRAKPGRVESRTGGGAPAAPPPRKRSSASAAVTPGRRAATSTHSVRFRYSRRRWSTRKGAALSGSSPASAATPRKPCSRNAPTVDQVKGVTGSGSTSPTFARVRRRRRGSGRSPASTVIGRACRSTGPSAVRAHSTSCGASRTVSRRRARSTIARKPSPSRLPRAGPSRRSPVRRSRT